MKRVILTFVLALLMITAGCQGLLKEDTPSPVETSVQPTESVTATHTSTRTTSPTQTQVDESVKEGLEDFAQAQKKAFQEQTNLTSVQVYRGSGTANLTLNYELPDLSPDTQEASFENSLEALVQSQYNWVVNGSQSNQADYITVKTDYGTASVSAELLQHYIDGKLDQETVAYIWAGKFDRYTALGDVDNESHTTRKARLAHTALVLERELETNGTYVMNVETEVEDETLYVAYEHTEDSPNPSWPIEDTAVAYRKTVTRLGPDYMPTNGVRAYDYFPNGTAQTTFFIENRWVVSEYVGIRPIGESSLNGLNSIEGMDGPHEGPP